MSGEMTIAIIGVSGTIMVAILTAVVALFSARNSSKFQVQQQERKYFQDRQMLYEEHGLDEIDNSIENLEIILQNASKFLEDRTTKKSELFSALFGIKKAAEYILNKQAQNQMRDIC